METGFDFKPVLTSLNVIVTAS